MLKQRRTYAIIIALLLIFLLAIIPIFNISFTTDAILNRLLLDLLQKGIIVVIIGVMIFIIGNYSFLKFKKENLLWCLPCFLVALVNFPISSLITKQCEIIRPELIPLLLLNCLLTSLAEEYVFRILLYSELKNVFPNKGKKIVFSCLISSLIFACIHFLNLLSGAGIIPTLMQVGYSFLIGCLLCITYEKTNNYWIIVIIHTIFNFGGQLIPYIGSGNFQDTTFWILTVSVGVLCAGHIIMSVIKMVKIDE